MFSNETINQDQVKDIRTESQANRKVAYDVGEKIGGARKDEFSLKKMFQDNHDIRNMQRLEDCSNILAAEMIR